MAPRNKQTQIVQDQSIQTGLQKRMPNLAIALAATPFTTPQLVALIQRRIDANRASDAAHATWLGTCATARQVMADTDAVMVALERYILSQVGEDAAALADFGLRPPKTGFKSAEAKALAAQKAAATRKANGTKGPRQRQAAEAARLSAAQAPAPAQPGPSPAQPAPATPGAAPPVKA